MVWIAVAALGGLGALGRFLLARRIAARRGPSHLPWGTLAVNLSGALLLGLVTGLALHGNALLLVGGAALGSYTTFSTWMLETHLLGRDGQVVAAAANIAATVVLGVAAAALGRAVGGWM